MTMNAKQKWALILALALITIIFAGIASAQTPSFQKNVKLTWTLPTKYDDGSTLAAADITKIQVYLANAAIADSSTMAPTVELTGASVNTTKQFTAFVGGTIYVRLKACTATLCSDFSTSLAIPTPAVKPGPPTNVTFELLVVAP